MSFSGFSSRYSICLYIPQPPLPALEPFSMNAHTYSSIEGTHIQQTDRHAMHCFFSWRLLDPKEKLSAGGWAWVWCPGGDRCVCTQTKKVMTHIHVSLSLCLTVSVSLSRCLAVSLCAGGDGSVCKRKESCDSIQRRLLNRHLRLEREGAD